MEDAEFNSEGRTSHRRAGRGHGSSVLGVSALIIAGLFVISALNLAVVKGGARGTVGPAAPTSACPQLKLPTLICHVTVIFLENQNESWVVSHAPFEKYLSKKYALASQYYSILHYSYPNYVAATSGTQTNYIHAFDKKNVVDLIRNTTGGMTWKAYYENMPHACYNLTFPGYKIAHNPFVFYSDIWSNQTLCQTNDVNFSGYTADIKAGIHPNYVFIGPNATHSCWKMGVPVCDPWLKKFVSPMINSSTFNSTAIFITYDEGRGTDLSGINGTTGGGHVYMAAVSPYSCPGFVSTHQYNHYDLMTTTEWLLGLGRTGYNDSWTQFPPMYDLFCFPNGTGGGGHLPSIPMAPTLPQSTSLQAVVREGARVGE